MSGFFTRTYYKLQHLNNIRQGYSHIPLEIFTINQGDVPMLRSFTLPSCALLFSVACLLQFVSASAQNPAIPKEYPLLDVHDVMTLPADSLARPSMFSPRQGDTVRLRGIVTVAPTINPEADDYRRLMAVGSGYAAYLYDLDTARKQFAGILVVQSDTNAKYTNFHKVKQGDLIEVYARINVTPRQADYSLRRLGNTIAEILTDMDLPPITPSNHYSSLPSAQVLPISTFNTGTNNQNNQGVQFNIAEGAKYVGMKVEFRNLTVIQDNPNFGFVDEQGNFIVLADQSCYFTHKAHRIEESEFRGYVLGQKILSITGMITMSLVGNVNGQQGVHPFTIAPVQMIDVDDLDRPPVISSVSRLPGRLFPRPTDPVNLNFNIVQGDNLVDPSKCIVEYSIDGTTWSNVTAVDAGGSFSASIPPQPANSVVRFRTKTADMKGFENMNPLNGIYYYQVLDRPIKIADINTLPAGITGNATQFITNMKVTIEPTITADTSDIPGSIGNFLIVMQDDVVPLSAMSAQSFDGSDPIFGVRRGDKIRVTGSLRTGTGSGTTFSEIDQYEVLSTGTPIAPVKISTAAIGPFYGNGIAFQWGGMVVEVNDVIIKDTNAPDGTNNGELTVADYSKRDSVHAFTRVALNNSRLKYTTRDSIATADGRTKPPVGNKFSFVRGLLSPGNGGYRILPRDNNDFGELTTGVVEYGVSAAADVSPNPANESASVRFTSKNGGFVRITLTDALGTPVRTLVSEILPAGNYTYGTGADLASGAYFAIVETPEGKRAIPFAITR